MTDQTPGGIETGSQAPCFAYMLLTHRDPRHVEELASRILDLSPAGHVVIHHDSAAGDLPWQGHPPDRVHFVERGRVLWGGWSIVAATLRMIRFAHDDLGADWFVMLSGEHRPVVDLRQWERSIMASGVDAFSEAEALRPSIHFGTLRRRRQPVPRTLPAPLGHSQGATLRNWQQGLHWVLENIPLRSALLRDRVRASTTGLVCRLASSPRPARGDHLLQGNPVDRVQQALGRGRSGSGYCGHRMVQAQPYPRRNVSPDSPSQRSWTHCE